MASGTDTSKFPTTVSLIPVTRKGQAATSHYQVTPLQAIAHQGHKFYLLLIFITYLSFEMIKFSIPEGFLSVCEQKEAYLISFFLQDSADGRGQRPRRHGAGAILGWLMLGQV